MSIEDSDPEVPPRPSPETTKSDNGLVDIGREDLLPRAKRRLGDYAAYLTKVVYKNEYSISPGSEDFTMKSPSGNPAPVTDESFGAETKYTDTLSEGRGDAARSIFESSSESGLLDTDTRFEIKKGKSDDNKRTGTEMFREIDEKLGEAEIPLRIEQVQLQNNRFTEKSPAYSSGQTEGLDNSIGSMIVQPALGEHAPGKFPKKIAGEGKNFTAISVNKLKQFGLMTILNASGEINIPVPGESNDYLTDISKNLSTMAPGIARLGKRVEVSRFDGVKILNEIEPGFSKQIRDNTLKGRPVLSYGNVNSVLVPFSGLVSASSINSASIMSLTVIGMIKSLYEFLNALGLQQRTKIVTELGQGGQEQRALRLGSYAGKDNINKNYMPYNEGAGLNLVSTSYPYFECANKGVEIFFYGKVGNSGEDIISEVQKSHGYQNVIFRNLIRGTSDLIGGMILQFTEDGRSSYDVDPNLGGTGNVITDSVESILGIIKLVNSSRLLKFMNIMATIGEIAIITEEGGMESAIDSISDIGEDFEGNQVPKLGVLHMKSRLSDTFGGKMAWGKSTVKSLYLLPTEVRVAANRYDGNDNRLSVLSRDKGFQSANGGRFSQDQVKRFEDYLEADYMPFYFHDLRTNEIISFHAFLESISDNFSVDYAETEGYGRIGKVYTYKNTDRSINMEFLIVATGPEDFDEMWYSINKLTTLLYPQYTEGRNLQTGNNSFVQPFSQIPAASPMIRLRLGDIFKSNYNKFNLARIFGLGSSTFYLEGREQTAQTQQDTQTHADAVNRVASAIRNRMTAGNWQTGDEAYLEPNWNSSWSRGHRPLSQYRKITQESNPGTRQGYNTGESLRITSRKAVRVTNNNVQRAENGGTTFEVAVELISPANDDERGTFTVSALGGVFLTLDEDYINRTAAERVPASPAISEQERQQDQTAINQFFSTEGDSPNPIFKSFESVRGRGLAGFIKSLNIDIDQTFPWETVGLNNRAPKMIKVSIAFLPVHDLQPGLDSNGFNTAPIYNIGNMMRKINDDTGGDFKPADTKYSTDTSVDRPPRRTRQ